MLKERRKYYTESCTRDSLRASIDSKTQNRYYINITAPNGDEFLPSNELKEVFQKHDIIWGGTWMVSDLAGSYAYNTCYYHFTTELTEKKFGKNVIDNLIKEAVAQYVRKNPEKIFTNDEHSEWLYKGTFPSYDGNDLLNKDFFKNFIYPDDYDYSKQKYQSLTYVILNLDEMGKVLKIKDFQHHIYSMHNRQYINYFEKEIKKFIKSSKFESLKYKGYPVKSEISFGLYYK
ncbi:hypothetical protein ACMGDK_07555 [Chryseobacterium sp. DT-3]